jgi:ribosomal protein S21
VLRQALAGPQPLLGPGFPVPAPTGQAKRTPDSLVVKRSLTACWQDASWHRSDKRLGKGYCLFVELREGETQEHLLTRFRQKIQRAGILREAKRRRHFVSRSELRRVARAKALRRARKRANRARSHNGRRPT